jgi:predicted amidohydrolase YtcJ
VPSTFFAGGTIWTGVNGQTTDALLVVDEAVQAVGERARSLAAGAEHVDLDGGFLMPSFGDGHAHPLPGGLEAVGPQVRRCNSVDEIVYEVWRFAAEHPDDEWIVGASYDSSLAPDGLFDARWLDAAVPGRPVVLRAWDYHTVWCNSVALERAGITAETPDPVLGAIPRRGDGSVLGTLREWGAVDLVLNVVPERDPAVRVDALRTAADYYLARGVTWVQDAWVEPADVDTYLDAAGQDKLAVRFNLGLYADPRYFDSQLEHFADVRLALELLSGLQPCPGRRVAPTDSEHREVLRRRGHRERNRRPARAVLRIAARPRHAGVGQPRRRRPRGRCTRVPDPHPRDRGCGGTSGAGRDRACRRHQRAARPPAGDRPCATRRRR